MPTLPRQSWKVNLGKLPIFARYARKMSTVLQTWRNDGSPLSGTKSVEVETPALKAAADDEQFELVGEMHEEIFHILIKCSTLSPLYSIYPKTWIRTLPKSGPLTIIFVWVTKGTEESNFKQMLETLEACFGFCSSHVVQANHL